MCTAACTSSPLLGTGRWLPWARGPGLPVPWAPPPATPTPQAPHPGPPHRLRPVDVGFMKALHEKVNIVPLIAKADCLVPGEIRKLKERVSLRGWGAPRGAWGGLRPPAPPLTALTGCRSGRRLTSLGSTCTSFLSVTRMRMRTSSSRIGN